ncbi:MAG: cytochrome d ubiquinol oxidase subunit II [Propionibacteriaceae bacterium]|nr:cytochrome d ubiquinol oxidase subunit II [Propionibacteriaceae bacterium]
MLTLLEVGMTPLQITWYLLIVVLWLGYFFLEGFDYGVAMLLPVLGRTEKKRRVMINTIGPVWDGNEVWLLTAGGATFAAFPGWYATLFSGLYLPLLLVLVGLILRGVAFEYRGKRDSDSWRAMFDWFAIVGSFLPALVLGVGFANFVIGLPTDENMLWAGTFLSLFSPFALLGGVLLVSLFLTHGAIFLSLKTDGEIRAESRAFALKSGLVTTVLLAAFVVWQNVAYPASSQFLNGSAIAWVCAILAVVTLLGAIYMTQQAREGWALILTGLSIVTLFVGIFVKMFGNLGFVQNPAKPLNIMSAAASETTLTLMTIAAAVFVPIVLAYQAWSYWVFSKRISTKHIPPAIKEPTSA